MENDMEVRRLQIEEAAKDLEWVEKCRNAGTVEEYVALYDEKGLELSVQEKEKLVEHFSMKSREGKLEDDQLEQATGGYIPLFDECPQRYDYEKCLRCESIFIALKTGCPNLRVVGVKKGNWYDDTSWEIVSCAKGYFQNQKGRPTWVTSYE